MTSLSLSLATIARHGTSQYQIRNSASRQFPRSSLHRSNFSHTRLQIAPLLCSKLFPWEATPTYSHEGDGASIIKGNNIVESIDAQDPPELPILDNSDDFIEMKNQIPLQQKQHPLKWPMWLFGPSILLATGMAPTLWLPLSSVFLGPNIAGFLSLVGLDCIFNMGATLFLLMADACARPKSSSPAQNCHVPFMYRFWNMSASLVGLLAPLLMLFASYKGYLQLPLPFISFSVLLGPYILLLFVQMLTEILTWQWKSPVWLLTPVVYETYRVLQLMRGLKLGTEVGAPAWAVDSIRWLVSWWVLILGIQLMWVAWFVGYASRTQEQT